MLIFGCFSSMLVWEVKKNSFLIKIYGKTKISISVTMIETDHLYGY